MSVANEYTQAILTIYSRPMPSLLLLLDDNNEYCCFGCFLIVCSKSATIHPHGADSIPDIDINFIPETLSIDKTVLEHPLIKLVRYDEMIGKEREAMHKLSCTVSFVDGKLVFTWEYGELIYNSVTVEELAAACAEQLLTRVYSHYV
ncbi:hypothetical protein [Photobacterium sp. OFAV2-7]|uniref:hypothetical protein n=1 Tax=Photobacterium sp. OFAV2-7 TaxID=2917748 RepID=UPI001EF48F11|nr:hypothetical protein [Photobacterium sp. OFAV2-7]MCG7586462.1 hypothetical protein [Photobacterium sp. OFAV2-7]